MTLNSIRCYTVTCDTCGCELGEEADYMPHFDTEQAAIEYAKDIGWVCKKSFVRRGLFTFSRYEYTCVECREVDL